MDDNSTATTPEDDITDAAAQAQLLAGFDGTETPTEKPAPTEVVPVVEPAVVATPEYVQLTKEAFDELMALKISVPEWKGIKETMDKQFGTAFGKMGGYDRWKAEQDAQVASANSLRAQITDAQIEALKGQDLNEVAAALDILRKIPVVPVASPPDPKVFDDMVQQRLADVLQKLPDVVDQQVELKLLTKAHPDWRTVKEEPGFAEYRKALPQAEQDKLNRVWDADYVGTHLAAYKKSKAKPTPKVETPNVQEISQRRASRMAAAATPRGTGQPAGADPDAEFLEGFETRRVGV